MKAPTTGPGHEVEPAKETVQHEVDRVGDAEDVGVDALLGDREVRAADAAQEAADGVGEHPISGDVDADRGQLLVLAASSETIAEARLVSIRHMTASVQDQQAGEPDSRTRDAC